MERRKIQIFDTTLRDGTQGEQVAFSVEDKIHIAKKLDDFGVDYIEAGWPGSNPKDLAFFDRAQHETFRHAKIVAFGSTMRAGIRPQEDRNLQAFLDANTSTICIFGKTWLLHVIRALKTTPEENLRIIEESLTYLRSKDKEVLYDAEHFFDGYKSDPVYAVQTLKAAERGGAEVIILCDTNGGTLTSEVSKIVAEVKAQISTPLGIHAHNDSELAVANSLAAIDSGCMHVQGTINGYGERCGNANLCSIIPNLQVKKGYFCVPEESLARLTSLSHFVSEVANLSHPHRAAFVGRSAFAHKGGVHVSAVMKDATTYEHMTPETVGNQRRVLVSDLSGRSNVFYKADELKVNLEEHSKKVPDIVEKLKCLENQGFQYEAAEASFDLLIRRMIEDWEEFFRLEGFRAIIEKNATGETRSEVSIRVNVNDHSEHTASEGSGPVHALDLALRKALIKFYPEIEEIHLSDYKVRVLNEKDGTSAKVRVLIESSAGDDSWCTVGVSENIIEASWQALMEGISYYLMKKRGNVKNAKSRVAMPATPRTKKELVAE
jgi:2-isopropylmalate synthase